MNIHIRAFFRLIKIFGIGAILGAGGYVAASHMSIQAIGLSVSIAILGYIGWLSYTMILFQIRDEDERKALDKS